MRVLQASLTALLSTITLFGAAGVAVAAIWGTIWYTEGLKSGAVPFWTLGVILFALIFSLIFVHEVFD